MDRVRRFVESHVQFYTLHDIRWFLGKLWLASYSDFFSCVSQGESQKDKGIYVKSVVPGGGAAMVRYSTFIA